MGMMGGLGRHASDITPLQAKYIGVVRRETRRLNGCGSRITTDTTAPVDGFFPSNNVAHRFCGHHHHHSPLVRPHIP